MAGIRLKKIGNIESYPVINAYELKRAEGFEPGVTSYRTWSRRGRIITRAAIRCDSATLSVEWDSHQQLVELATSPRRPGGFVTYMLCPRCQIRRARLVIVGDTLACRFCQHLSYESENSRHGAGPHWHNARRIRERFGGSGDMSKPFPARPRYCNTQRYWRAWAKSIQIETKLYAALESEVQRLKGKIR